MKVLLVTPRFAPEIGGVETHVLRLSEELALAGHEVIVATTSGRTRVRRETMTLRSGARLEVYRSRHPRHWHPEIPTPGFAMLVAQLSRGCDVVHLHSYHALAALVGALVARPPKVATFHYHGTGHTLWRRRLHRLYFPFGRWLVTRCRRVIAVSATEAQLLQRDFPHQLNTTPAVIPNGTDPLTPADPYPVGIPVVLSVCRLEPYKRVDVLVEARRAADTPWRLVVVGDGPDLADLAARQVPEVEFLGRVSDEELARWWATATLVVSASREEAFGLTVAQALNAGVRCVASDIPAHRELVEFAGTGQLITSDDPQHWAVAIDEQLRAAPPTPGHLSDWAEVARRVAEVYREVQS